MKTGHFAFNTNIPYIHILVGHLFFFWFLFLSVCSSVQRLKPHYDMKKCMHQRDNR